MQTIKQTLRHLSKLLRKINQDNPQKEADIILEEVLGQNSAYFLTHPEQILEKKEQERLTAILEKRLAGKPLAHILGFAHFRNLILKVNPNVLIPRPETELLVELVIKHIEQNRKKLTIADVGTGSGAIALSLLQEVGEKIARLYAIDVSHEALKVAKENAKKIHTSLQPIFLKGNLLEPIEEKLDLVIANLPYIPKEELNSLPSTVKDFEPLLALDGKENGLKIIFQLLKQAKNKLNTQGKVFLEIHESQGDLIKQKALHLGYTSVQVLSDLTDRIRYTVIQ